MAVKHIPEGYRSATPYLMVEGAAKLLELVKNAFNATETERMTRPDGAIAHAEAAMQQAR